ncbi:MAG TPA: 1,2-phenylacetyl-CoA epoxidase subunit PaaC [Chitinophagales bacterium]|nr:1,2-phenylacetyl-CoA epoxidase subunit PaaC [Chitinophagales bacterium]
MNNDAIKDLILRMADDALVLGHRNSEWTGIGPIMEEDIAFSSMAQDKIGHAQALYQILHEHFGMPEPDVLGFQRNESEFKSCQLVELPIGDYAFSLVRHFFFDHADALRYEILAGSSFQPLANLAKKIKGELKYHTLHADVWVKKLGNGTEESKARMQSAINETFPYALGIFEESKYENELKAEGVFEGEVELYKRWLEKITPLVEQAGLKLPEVRQDDVKLGGRSGYHTEYLQPMLTEMNEVISSDYNTEW